MAELGYDVVSIGVGGSTWLRQRDAFLDADNLADNADRTLIMWDGDPNGRETSTIVGGISGTTLTVSAITAGGIGVGTRLNSVSGTPTITAAIAANPDGTGTWQLSAGPGTVAPGTSITTSRGTYYWEMLRLQEVLAALGHGRWGIIRSGCIGPQRVVGSTTLVTARGQDDLDLDAFYDRVAVLYGAWRVHDPRPGLKAGLPALDLTTAAGQADASDEQFGYFRRTQTSDGTHLSTGARRIIAPGIAAWAEPLMLR
jgi:hypothetical protein